MKRYFLMNTADGSNGGGAVTPPPAGDAGAAAPTPAPGTDVNELKAQIAQLNQQLAQQNAVLAQVAQRSGPQTPPPASPHQLTQEEFESLDPATQKLFQQQQIQNQQNMARMQDAMDMNDFRALVNQTKPPPEVLKRANDIWREWQATGKLNIDASGQPVLPKRLEALQIAYGETAMAGGNIVNPEAQRAAEEARQRASMNTNADVLRPGVLRVVSVPATLPADPNSVPLADRVKPGGYWEQMLDSNGAW